jgi:nucleoside-diphosphate-sugar epimerase
MRCLVTGAAGFIGTALCKRLIHEGHQVNALLHQHKPVFTHNKITYIWGDITNQETLHPAVEDVDIIFHCAALVQDYGPKKLFFQVNYEGTKNLVTVCMNHKIKRFIFLSTISSESTGHLAYYSLTKTLAEQYLLDQYKQQGFPMVIVRPGNVYGPHAATWILRPLRAIQKNRIVLVDGGNGICHHTYIDNLLDALISTIDAPQALGEKIDITDRENDTTWGTYLNVLARIAGKPPITKHISKNTAFFIGYILMASYFLFKRKPLVTPLAVKIFTNKNIVSLEKAQQILNYQPNITFDEGMKYVETWLKQGAYIPLNRKS